MPEANSSVGRVDNWGEPVPEHVLKWESEMAGRRGGRSAKPAIVIIVVLIAVIGALGNDKDGKKASGERASTPSDHGATGSQTLFVSGLEQVAVARTQEALDRFIKASGRDESYGYAELARSGDIILVGNGTRVRVLDYGFARHQIRVLEGPEAGASGWVPREWIRGR